MIIIYLFLNWMQIQDNEKKSWNGLTNFKLFIDIYKTVKKIWNNN